MAGFHTVNRKRQMLEDVIKTYLINEKQVDPAKFDIPDLQVSALQLDSLDMVEMLFEVEDRCGFRLPDPMRYLTMSFADMVADIEAAVHAHGNGDLPDWVATKPET
jgi:acyl carrier protein